MLREELDALACEAANDALGYPVPHEMVSCAMIAHAGYRTEDLVDRLAEKLVQFRKAPRRGRSLLSDEIATLKIALAVRAAVPGVEIVHEIEINTHCWATRVAPTLTVSLDCLANILTHESAIIDPKKVAGLMATLCRMASPAFRGNFYLAEKEAERYETDAGSYGAEDEQDEGTP